MSARAWDRRRLGKRLRAAIRHVDRHPDAAVLVGDHWIVMGLHRALDVVLEATFL